MPTPIVHITSAVIITSAISSSGYQLNKWKRFVFTGICISIAVIPDLDLIPGWIVGDMNYFHHGFTHSFFFSVVMAVAGYNVIRRMIPELLSRKVFAAALICALSHPLLDYMCEDTRLPFGCPLFWPFNDSSYISPITIFPAFNKGGATPFQLISSVIVPENIRAAGIELLICLSALTALLVFKKYQRHKINACPRSV